MCAWCQSLESVLLDNLPEGYLSTGERENGLKREEDKEPAEEAEESWLEVSCATDAKSVSRILSF